MDFDLTDVVSATLVDEWVPPVIDAEIERQRGLENFRAVGLHPSQVGGVCPREAVMSAIIDPDVNPRDLPSPKLFRIFNDGHAFHHWYQNRYLGPAGVLYGEWVCSRCKRVVEGFMPKDACDCMSMANDCVADDCMALVPEMCFNKCGQEAFDYEPFYWRDEEKVAARGGCVWCGQNNPMAWGEWTYREPRIEIPDLKLVGHVDGLIFINGVWFILEIKTINDNGFKWIKGPSEKYKGQGTCYHAAFKLKGEPYNLAEAVLFVFINKNGAPKLDGKPRKEKEFLVHWDDESERIMDDIRLIRWSLDNQELPGMIHGCSQTKRNRKCRWWEICSLTANGREGWEEIKGMKP
jgi:hypothetical protein